MNLVQKLKRGKIAIHCDTEEKAKRFVKWCFKNDMIWKNSDSSETHYRYYKENTCYTCARDGSDWDFDTFLLEFSNKIWYEQHGYKVISFDEFMKEVDGMKEFTLKDLKAGKHVVETSHGKKYLVCLTQSGLVGVNSNGWINFNNYQQDMTYCHNNIYCIMKVYEIQFGSYFDGLLDESGLTLVWERKEEVKELTMADIEKLVGCKVKIVKEEN